jgi:Icc-related predicted phosphoesterase
MYSFFVSDLHGVINRYEKLFNIIQTERPEIVFIGGDILPSYTHKLSSSNEFEDFIDEYLLKNLYLLKEKMKDEYPEVFLILGNDDLKTEEEKLIDTSKTKIFNYISNDKKEYKGIKIFGYSYVPPTPFLLKDWEKYDVSRYVDPGCVPPDEGFRSVNVEESEIKYSTIKDDLDKLTKGEDLSNTVFLFHSPPYKTNLDRVANDGKFYEHVPLDLYAGSIAIKRFIEERQPMLTLHGHIHESTRLKGSWKDKIGKTNCFNASHDGPELSLIKFDLNNIDDAIRVLI